ncbi:hypothetical protein CBL_05357 [Carabus blaptoides fortunei]
MALVWLMYILWKRRCINKGTLRFADAGGASAHRIVRIAGARVFYVSAAYDVTVSLILNAAAEISSHLAQRSVPSPPTTVARTIKGIGVQRVEFLAVLVLHLKQAIYIKVKHIFQKKNREAEPVLRIRHGPRCTTTRRGRSPSGVQWNHAVGRILCKYMRDPMYFFDSAVGC